MRTCACANFSGRSWADADDTEDAHDICAENAVPEQSQGRSRATPDDAPSATLCGANIASNVLATTAHLQDDADPWADAIFPEIQKCGKVSDAWKHYLPSVPPPLSPPLDPRAAPFEPHCVAAPASPLSGDHVAASTISLMQQLIDCQNHTIAVLTHDVDLLRAERSSLVAPSADSPPYVTHSHIQRLNRIELSVTDLAKSMGATVQDSINSRLESQELQLEVQVQKLMYEHMKELVMPLVHDHCTRIATNLSEHLETMDAKFKKGIRFLLQELDALKLCPPRVDGAPAGEQPIIDHTKSGLPTVPPPCVAVCLAPRPHVDGDIATPKCFQESTSPPCVGVSTKQLGVGCTVNIVGLTAKLELNGSLASVIGLDAPSGRHIVKVSGHDQPIRIKPTNLSFPASCPLCNAEVTSNQCYACTHEDDTREDTLTHEHIHCDALAARSSTSGSQDSQVVM